MIQKRSNLFETNSSSEHSLVIGPSDEFLRWKKGELLARIKEENECGNTWGNFWSNLLTLEFTDDFEKAKKENENSLNFLKEKLLTNLERRKKECLSYKKLVEKELTEEEQSKLSVKDKIKYLHDLTNDRIHQFDEQEYIKEKRDCENLTIQDYLSFGGDVAPGGIWLSFEQFWKEFTEISSCYSPFEHDDPITKMHIIGKYYHS